MSDFSKERTYALFDTPANKKRITELSQAGIETFLFPTISTKIIEQNTFIFNNLADFDWLIFPDVYTVEYFVDLLEILGIDLYELDELRVLAFGEAVADRLRFSQLHADVIPATTKTSDILQALKDYVFEGFTELRFLVLTEQSSKFEIADELSKLNAKITELPIYTATVSDETQIPKLKALLKGGAIEEFIFSTHFDVLNLAQLFQTENLSDLLQGIHLTATDNLALQSLQEFRLIEK